MENDEIQIIQWRWKHFHISKWKGSGNNECQRRWKHFCTVQREKTSITSSGSNFKSNTEKENLKLNDKWNHFHMLQYTVTINMNCFHINDDISLHCIGWNMEIKRLNFFQSLLHRRRCLLGPMTVEWKSWFLNRWSSGDGNWLKKRYSWILKDLSYWMIFTVLNVVRAQDVWIKSRVTKFELTSEFSMLWCLHFTSIQIMCGMILDNLRGAGPHFEIITSLV